MPKPDRDDSAIAGAPPLVQFPRREGGHGLVEHVSVRRSRLIDKEVGAEYLGTSLNTINRLIETGALPIVKLPVERAKNGRAQVGVSRRVLIDVRDLDALIERSKETSR